MKRFLAPYPLIITTLIVLFMGAVCYQGYNEIRQVRAHAKQGENTTSTLVIHGS